MPEHSPIFFSQSGREWTPNPPVPADALVPVRQMDRRQDPGFLVQILTLAQTPMQNQKMGLSAGTGTASTGDGPDITRIPPAAFSF